MNAEATNGNVMYHSKPGQEADSDMFAITLVWRRRNEA